MFKIILIISIGILCFYLWKTSDNKFINYDYLPFYNKKNSMIKNNYQKRNFFFDRMDLFPINSINDKFNLNSLFLTEKIFKKINKDTFVYSNFGLLNSLLFFYFTCEINGLKELQYIFSNCDPNISMRKINSMCVFLNNYFIKNINHFIANTYKININDNLFDVVNKIPNSNLLDIKEIDDKKNLLRNSLTIKNIFSFSGVWKNSFDENKIKNNFMYQINHFKYFENDKLKMLAMEYQEPYILLTIINKDDNSEIYNYKQIKEYYDKSELKLVKVKYPRFKIKYEINFTDVLKKLNIQYLFNLNQFQNINLIQICTLSVRESGLDPSLSSDSINFEKNKKYKKFYATRPFNFYLVSKKNLDIILLGKKN